MSPLSLSMQDLQRRQLDAQLGADARLRETEQPERGWLFAIRKSLGMQTRQFARLLRITPQAASAIERSEREGTITLASLRKAADALNCDVVLARRSDFVVNGNFARSARCIRPDGCTPARSNDAR